MMMMIMIHRLELNWNAWQVWIEGVLCSCSVKHMDGYVTHLSAPWCLTHVKPLLQNTVQRCCYSTRNCASSPLFDLFSGNFCLTKDTRVASWLHHNIIGFLSFWVNSGVHKWTKKSCHTHSKYVKYSYVKLCECQNAPLVK